MRQVARVWGRLGRRGSALAFFGVLDLVYGFSLACPPVEQKRTAAMHWQADLLPLWGWASIWSAVGAVCLWQAWRDNDRVAYAAAIFMKIVWGAVYVSGWIAVGLDRAYVAAAIWWGLAGLVGVISTWPEVRVAQGRQ